MNLAQLKKIVAKGESDHIEFKKSTSLLEDALKTACAFLNCGGGIVLIGVGDTGKIVGQEVSDATSREIAQKISKLEPSAQSSISIDYIPISGKNRVIAISIDAGQHVPYVYDGRPYQRIQNTTYKMAQHQYEQLIIKRGQLNHAWDEQEAIGYKINDLDHEEIRRTILSGIHHRRIANEIINYDIKQILHYLELLTNGKLINAAVVLYAKKMTYLYSHCEIRMTRYRGNDKLADFIDSKHVTGNAFQLLLEADYFIMRHLPVESFFDLEKSTKRIDKTALPVMAIREALINSICHRDYFVKNSSIALAIFDSHLEIWNNGPLPPQLHIDDLKKRHDSFPRNKKIASIFRMSGWVEKAGVGTTRMVNECKSFGVPEPEFEEYSSGFAVTFKFAKPIGVQIGEKTATIKLSKRQEEILSIIKKHNVTNIRQIINELKNPPSRTMVKKDLDYLKRNNLIELRGEARSAQWIIR